MQQPPMNLSQLRKIRGFSKLALAQSLRLGIDVWNKLEEGTILLETLSPASLSMLANSLHVPAEEFCQLLTNSHPPLGRVCLRKGASCRTPTPQAFHTALVRSEMCTNDKQFWRTLQHDRTEQSSV